MGGRRDVRDSKRKLVVRFVQALVGGETAYLEREHFVTGTPALRLHTREVRALVSDGVLIDEENSIRPSADARSWLRRALLEADAFTGQHRIEARTKDGVLSNLAESPLARLATSLNGEPAFLARHQVEAGERVRRLVERAQLRARVTMSYSGSHVASGRSAGAGPADVTEVAADARRALSEVWRVLPKDCAGVVVDVCGLMKGLQTVEIERGWPRRSAKLVLRIALEHLAAHFGLASEAVGAETRRLRNWIEEGARPDRFE